MRRAELTLKTAEHLASFHPHIILLHAEAAHDRQLVGGKAANLAELDELGVPVPLAIAVSVEAYREFVKTGRFDQQLLADLEFIRAQLGGKVAVRSSATCEDGSDLSMAGVFETLYLQDDTLSIETALRSIYAQAQSAQVSEYLQLHGVDAVGVEMGVILQTLITPRYSGVLYTDVDGDGILVQYTDGFGDALVDGKTEGSSVVIAPSDFSIRRSKNTDLRALTGSEIQELVEASLQIKAHFADAPQDVEFAIDAAGVHILQARTLTTEMNGIELEMSPEDSLNYTKEQLRKLIEREKAALGTDRVVYSDSNFSELLPRPKEMDFGVFAYIFTGSDGVPGAIQEGRKEMGYPLEHESVEFMYYVGGKPYFSIAQDAHTFYAGFPETKEEYSATFVTDYLKAIEQDKSKGEYPEMGLYVQDPTLADLEQRFGDKAPEYYERYLQFKAQMAEHAASFLHEYLDEGKPSTDAFIAKIESLDLKTQDSQHILESFYEVLEHLRTVSCVHFVKSARLGFYYSQRLRQMLVESAGVNADDVDQEFALLNQGLDGSEITAANLRIVEQETLVEAVSIGKKVVGHYSTGEMLEIRHPRLKDSEDALRQYVESIYASREAYGGEFASQKEKRLAEETRLIGAVAPEAVAEFQQVMQASQTYMALRETVKYQFVKEYSLLRDMLVELEQRFGLEAGAIFSLYPREIGALVAEGVDFKAKIKEREERFRVTPTLHLPPVICESDLATLGESEVDPLSFLELFGKLLAQGMLLERAVIVNIEDFETVEAAREVLRFYKEQALPIVLVASQMNLSHDPLIVQADALIIENAGIVSHGAQRARELGRGALGGIKANALKTGEFVIFDPSMKKVTRTQ